MYILFDIGGTKMRIAGSRDCKGFVDEPIVVDTPADFKKGMKLLEETISTISNGEEIEIIGGGISGPFNQETGSLVGGPNLNDWIGKPFRQELEDMFNASVFVENDTAVVGLGEMHHGAGAKEDIGVYMTISTGVGGARFIDGHIDASTIGFEPGHEVIDPDKSMCPDCESGELESYIGGAATEKRMGMKPYEITEPGFWDTYAKYLAYGLNNMIVHWSPKVVVLGGSMIVGDPAIPVERTIQYLKDMLTIFPELPEIKKAELGALGGLYGAMVLISQNL
ncbi:ROK family protein [Candidatus Kaiserbacteria bacterium]|nr:ROK family protein [Candidatus Kaiserbacteria bacterium]